MRRRARILLNAATVLSLAVCLATLGLWYRSCFVISEASWVWFASSGWPAKMITVSVESSLGDVRVARGETRPEQWVGPPLPSYRAEVDRARVWPGRAIGLVFFGWKTGDAERVFPYWALAAVFGAWPFVRFGWALIRPRQRRQTGGYRFCPACGYDLRATPGRCPECGAVPTPSA